MVIAGMTWRTSDGSVCLFPFQSIFLFSPCAFLLVIFFSAPSGSSFHLLLYSQMAPWLACLPTLLIKTYRPASSSHDSTCRRVDYTRRNLSLYSLGLSIFRPFSLDPIMKFDRAWDSLRRRAL